jgi:DNA integrity scanning protein DisA with diadenylate cyclase activity
MAVNTSPIFPLTPVTSWSTTIIKTENTAMDGTGTLETDIFEVATGGTYGTRIDQIKIRALGTNITTVMRFFINNGSTNATAANNALIHEITCLSTTADVDGALDDLDVLIYKGVTAVPPIQILPVGYRLLVTIGKTVATGFTVTVSGGDY